jgi:hypothetical protein
VNDLIVDELLAAVPADVLHVPGVLAYSGREAWTSDSPVYLLGLNPGGDPALSRQTVAEQFASALTGPPNYSAYRDEAWSKPKGGSRAPGQAPLQRRVRHMLDALGLDPGAVPSSNLVFVRSRREADIRADEMWTLAERCWPFHSAIIDRLGVRVVVCFGGTVAAFVREKVGADTESDRYVERNRRGWTSRAFKGDRVTVVQLTHPSLADWTNPDSDPTGLAVRALANHRSGTVGWSGNLALHRS